MYGRSRDSQSKKHVRLATKIAAAMFSYVKTQLLLTGIVMLASWSLLTWLNVQFAGYLALLTAALSVVPVLGITIAAIITGIVAVFDGSVFLPMFPSIIEGVVLLALFGLLNIVIDYFISPYLIGTTVKIHPVIVICAVLLGTLAFGLIGAIFTMPVIIVLKTIQDHHAQR